MDKALWMAWSQSFERPTMLRQRTQFGSTQAPLFGAFGATKCFRKRQGRSRMTSATRSFGFSTRTAKATPKGAKLSPML